MKADRERLKKEIEAIGERLVAGDEELEAEQNRLRTECSDADRAARAKRTALSDLQRKVAQGKAAARALREEAERCLANAREHSRESEERYRSECRPVTLVNGLLCDERQKLKTYLEHAAVEAASETCAKHAGLKKDVEEARRFVRALENSIAKLGAAIKARRDGVLRVRGVTCRSASASFVEGQHRRGYGGKLTIKHDAKALELQVRPKCETEWSKVQSLSGGEKSYALTSLLLALWEVIDCPFFGVDEFDVCLDDVNRAATVEFLAREALAKTNHQFIFITPLSLRMVDPNDAHLRMLRMDAAE
jgi:chromosome segregation ATPase